MHCIFEYIPYHYNIHNIVYCLIPTAPKVYVCTGAAMRPCVHINYATLMCTFHILRSIQKGN